MMKSLTKRIAWFMGLAVLGANMLASTVIAVAANDSARAAALGCADIVAHANAQADLAAQDAT